ncbi:MAG: hypothetical protein AABX51_08880, partial [Nanoarchaeota archaeon]
GHEVHVFEQAATNGSRFHGDFQGLINWQKDEDILDFLKGINIKISFPFTPLSETTIYDHKLKPHKFISGKPLFYLVKRGPFPDSLDAGIRKQAEELGVKFHWNSRFDPEVANIIATGPKRTDLLDIGYLFKTDLPDMIAAILDDSMAPKVYAYLVVIKGEGTCATVMTHHFIDSKKYLEKTWQAFNKLYSINAKELRLFSGYGNFAHSGIVKMNQPVVGEAANFQDALFGAGMQYAFHSGYLAAKSIHEGIDYSALVKKELEPSIRASIVNRFVFEKIGNKGYSFILGAGLKKKNIIGNLKKRYNEGKLTKILYPFAIKSVKKRYSSKK